MNINTYLSEELAEMIDAQDRECYKNSVMAMYELADREDCFEILYIEGWAISVIPTEHAWLKYNGTIVDPTYFGQNERETRMGTQRHEPPERAVYFPGKKYTLEQVQDYMDERGHLNENLRFHHRFSWVRNSMRPSFSYL